MSWESPTPWLPVVHLLLTERGGHELQVGQVGSLGSTSASPAGNPPVHCDKNGFLSNV